jgi:hypothetical protein
MKIGKSEREFWMGEAFRDHADWRRRASRMLDENGGAGRGVELRIGGWLLRRGKGCRVSGLSAIMGELEIGRLTV